MIAIFFELTVIILCISSTVKCTNTENKIKNVDENDYYLKYEENIYHAEKM